MLHASNMTAAEHLRINGTLPIELAEQLVEYPERLEALEGIDAYMSEAMGQYPEEDFLSDPISRLHALAKRVRGDNRDEVLAIIEQLDDIAQTTFNSADYGRDELRKGIKLFKDKA